MNKLAILIIFCFSYANLLNGLDILEQEKFNQLDDKNIGLVINHTSLNKDGIHILELLSAYKNIHIQSIFTPEHGLKGSFSAGSPVLDIFNDSSGISIISLYGNRKEPTWSQISNLDYIIFDIQDIGSRYYTYVSTLTYILNAASKAKVPVIVLDRPNPLGRKVFGPNIYTEFQSFVGMHSIPIRHGMTIGELAIMINEQNWLPSEHKAELIIYKMENWDKKLGYFSIPPSPNIPDFNTALLYNGMCLLEGTNLSEGRGTNEPFLLIGSPWLNVAKNIEDLNALGLEEVVFLESNFVPISIKGMSEYPKYQNELCHGIKIKVTNMYRLEPLKLAVSILKIIYENHPNQFSFNNNNFISKLYGSNEIKINILNKEPIEILYDDWKKDSEKFINQRKPYLLY